MNHFNFTVEVLNGRVQHSMHTIINKCKHKSSKFRMILSRLLIPAICLGTYDEIELSVDDDIL